MRSLCIAGISQPDIDRVRAALIASGMAAPQPAQRSASIDIHRWHEQVCALDPDDDEAPGGTELGKLWEQLAGDIFLANIDSPVWGWADTRSTQLLEFWRKFDPKVRFVLVWTSPARMIAAAIQDGNDDTPIEDLMARWAAHHRQLLSFQKRFPKQTLLIDAGAVERTPGSVADQCSIRWRLPLEFDPAAMPPAVAASEIDPLALHLAGSILGNYRDVENLCLEYDDLMQQLGINEPSRMIGDADISSLIEDFRRLVQQTGSREEIERLEALVAQRDVELGDLRKALEDFEEVRRALDVSRERLEATEGENALLLEQLHAVQEELESRFHEAKAAETAHADELAKRARELGELSAAHEAAIREIDVLRQSAASLTQAREAAEQARSDLARQLAESKERSAQDATALAQTREHLKEAETEGEILLEQLHQVQEELEHYFEMHRAAQAQTRVLEDRWERLLQRHPELCDCEQIELVAHDAEKSLTTWRLHGLQAAGRAFDSLTFGTVLRKGYAGIVFERNSGDDGPLVRWPGLVAGKDRLLLLPVGRADHLRARLALLADLSASDWQLTRSLVGLLRTALASEAYAGAADDFAVEPLVEGLRALSEFMDAFPTTLRFDHVRLKREQVNPDYEHLWLRLERPSLGGEVWPTFEFRLSCAHVTPERFGLFPKLEFPEGPGQLPFSDWFVEGYDDFGARLELRFSLSDGLDIATWKRFSQHDREFVLALAVRVPSLLVEVESAGTTLARPWADWHKLATEIRRLLANRSDDARSVEEDRRVESVAAAEPANLNIADDQSPISRETAVADAGAVTENANEPGESTAPAEHEDAESSPVDASDARRVMDRESARRRIAAIEVAHAEVDGVAELTATERGSQPVKPGSRAKREPAGAAGRATKAKAGTRPRAAAAKAGSGAPARSGARAVNAAIAKPAARKKPAANEPAPASKASEAPTRRTSAAGGGAGSRKTAVAKAPRRRGVKPAADRPD